MAPTKVEKALEFCLNPFSLDSVLRDKYSSLGLPETLGHVDKIKAKILNISAENFFYLYLYANRSKILFTDCGGAFFYLNNHTDLRSDEHCLSRAFFVAKTSGSFDASGVLFVGALLPTYQMHAWIIDGSRQPDPSDRDWINYTPLLAFY